MNVPILACDIGGTKINAAVVDGERIGPVVTTPTPAREGGQAVVQALIALGREALTAAHAADFPDASTQIAGIGVASAGVIDSERGVVAAATDSITQWAGTHLTDPLASAFGVQAWALNDVHAHGLGEATYGVGVGRSSLLLMAIGTGVGGAFVDHGAVLTGHRGAGAHIGHIPVPEATDIPCSCGRIGHLEALAAGPSIARLARSNGLDVPDTRSLVTLINSTDDPRARDVFEKAGYATGRAIGALMNTFDPHVVAVTGGVASATGRAGELWWRALRDGVVYDAMPALSDTPVVEAQAGNYAALVGAAVFAATRIQ